MRRGGKHQEFEKYQSFRRFEDDLVDCGVFSKEWRDKMLRLVEDCMKHAYSTGYETAQVESEQQDAN